jgi:sugar/nucleoside kinase (ribokinase family)
MDQHDIAIAGETNLDLILYGLPQQMPLDRELIAENFSLTLGGSSAILAHNLAALGVKVGFATKIGSDPLTTICLERLCETGAKLSYANPSSGDRIGITLQLHHGNTRHTLTYLGVSEKMSAAEIDLDFISSSRHFHISSLFLQKAFQHDLPALCRQLKQRGLTLSLDTNDDPDDKWAQPLEELLHLVDVLLPNEDEAKRMMHTDDLKSAMDSLARYTPIVAVKCGARGSMVQAGKTRWILPPLYVEPVDTIGAGDSFNAGFLKSYIAGLPLEECAAAGNATAALSTLRPGGTEAFRDRGLLQMFLSQHSTILVPVAKR